jgi:hypothetical protein
VIEAMNWPCLAIGNVKRKMLGLPHFSLRTQRAAAKRPQRAEHKTSALGESFVVIKPERR